MEERHNQEEHGLSAYGARRHTRQPKGRSVSFSPVKRPQVGGFPSPFNSFLLAQASLPVPTGTWAPSPFLPPSLPCIPQLSYLQGEGAGVPAHPSSLAEVPSSTSVGSCTRVDGPATARKEPSGLGCGCYSRQPSERGSKRNFAARAEGGLCGTAPRPQSMTGGSPSQPRVTLQNALLGRGHSQGNEDTKEKAHSPLACGLTWSLPSSGGLAALPSAPAPRRSDGRQTHGLWAEAERALPLRREELSIH